MKMAAWASLVLALAFWPLYVHTYGLLIMANFPHGPAAQQSAGSDHFRSFQIFAAVMLISFLASAWLSGLSFRQARIVAGLALAINIGSVTFILSVFLPIAR